MLTLVTVFFILGSYNTVAFAQKSELESESIDEVINLNEVPYKDVSEEEVISNYIVSENVDRKTAIEELGIMEGKQTRATCHESWREYYIGKKLIDKGSRAYLQTNPYIRVKQCGNSRPQVTGVSTSVSYKRESSFGPGAVVVNSITANKESKYVVRVRANGYVKNVFGKHLRDWIYSQTFTFV